MGLSGGELVGHKTNYAKSVTLGIGSHNLISDYVNWLKTLVMTSAPGDKKVNCANIMYAVPRLAATFHLAPLIPPAESDLIGVNSPYFDKLRHLNALYPIQADLEALVSFGMCCPIAFSAAQHLFWHYKQSSDLPALPLQGGLCQPRDEGQILYGLLVAFSNLSQYESIIELLQLRGLLSCAIQCLLGFLPQFNNTKAAAMKRTEVLGNGLGQIIEGVHWISKDIKMNLWEENANNERPRDRAFWLLSAVESLQWPDNSEFGIVDSLYSFLVPEVRATKKKTITKKAEEAESEDLFKAYLDGLSLFLNQITFYFNIRCLTPDEKKNLACNLQRRLRTEVAKIASLSATVSMWHAQQAHVGLSNDFETSIAAVAQALLNVSDPRRVTYKDVHTERRISLARGDLERLDIYKDSSNEPSDLISRLNWPWGVYENIETPDRAIGHAISLNVLNSGTIDLDFDEERNLLAIASERSQIELGSYLHDAVARIRVTDFKRIISEEDVKENWYETPFDEYYIEFDKLRQTDGSVDEFALRGSKEGLFYKQLLEAEAKKLGNKPIILDIGVGYGRLAEKLIKDGLISKENYHGVDLSPIMISACEKLVPKDHLYQCNMNDVEGLFAGKGLRPDVVICAFTTFGCYRGDADLKTLRGLANVVNQYGLLIIEQHNPLKDEIKQSVLVHELKINGKKVELVKTTHLMRYQDWADYIGQYRYYELKPEGACPIRTDPYCVRLYSDNWLRKNLEEMNLYAEFCADFEVNKSYNDHRTDATTMICVARKLPVKLHDLKNAVKKAIEFWAYIKRFFQKQATRLKDCPQQIMNYAKTEDDAVLRAVLEQRPAADELELMIKSIDRDVNDGNAAKYVTILGKWFKTML